jgi:hypothetical protein
VLAWLGQQRNLSDNCSGEGGLSQAIEQTMDCAAGCTHMRYLIHALANASCQAISAYRVQIIPELGASGASDEERPFSLNQCME